MITDQTYETDGQTTSITYASGVTTTFTYSPTRRWLTRVVTKNAGGVSLLDNRYTRDAEGRILSINGLQATDDWTYTYDDLDQLITANNGGDNTLDAGGGKEIDPVNRLPAGRFTYAANDNMLSRTRIAGAYVYPVGTAVRPHTPTSVGAWR